jgi:hypothetical protein
VGVRGGGFGVELDGTDAGGKLSSDKLWIARNRQDLERLWGGGT